MKLSTLALSAIALTFASCASPPVAQTFQAPSLAPAEQAVARVEQHVQGAKGAAQKLADECAKKDAGWQSAYTALMDELTQAYLSTQSAQEELASKQGELNLTIEAANKDIEAVGKDRDAQKAKADAEYHKKMFWMKGCFGAAAIALLLGAWITKRLWLPLLAGL